MTNIKHYNRKLNRDIYKDMGLDEVYALYQSAIAEYVRRIRLPLLKYINGSVRNGKRVSQDDLAKVLGVSRQKIIRYMKEDK